VELFAAMKCAQKREYAPVEIGHRELRFFNFQQVEEMIFRSEVQDPSTIIAFFKYRRFENQVLDGPV
jgi:hypothetical protein